jgi:hypothetical protein
VSTVNSNSCVHADLNKNVIYPISLQKYPARLSEHVLRVIIPAKNSAGKLQAACPLNLAFSSVSRVPTLLELSNNNNNNNNNIIIIIIRLIKFKHLFVYMLTP